MPVAEKKKRGRPKYKTGHFAGFADLDVNDDGPLFMPDEGRPERRVLGKLAGHKVVVVNEFPALLDATKVVLEGLNLEEAKGRRTSKSLVQYPMNQFEEMRERQKINERLALKRETSEEV